jgi:hypothetical protein
VLAIGVDLTHQRVTVADRVLVTGLQRRPVAAVGGQRSSAAVGPSPTLLGAGFLSLVCIVSSLLAAVASLPTIAAFTSLTGCSLKKGSRYSLLIRV